MAIPRLAAAVEAVASSDGQIMPPLIGAGAFVMVELTGVPYTGIMAAAALPALLYFVAVWMGINTYARRELVEGRADSNGTWHQALYHSVGHGRQSRLLRLSDAPLAALLAAVRVALGLTLLSSGLIGAGRPIQTIALCAAGLAVVFSGPWF